MVPFIQRCGRPPVFTRFGNMSAQMRNFFDQTGGLWVKGALAGQVASVLIASSDGSRQPDARELELARQQGAWVAKAGRLIRPPASRQ